MITMFVSWVTDPAQPGTLYFLEVTSTSIRVLWSGNSTTTTLRISSVDPPFSSQQFVGDARTFLFANLNPTTVYTITVTLNQQSSFSGMTKTSKN